jgi:hypothetical protein
MSGFIDLEDALEMARGDARLSSPPHCLLARPYVRRDPATIPPRPWLYGHTYLRGCLSVLVAPGGTGKSLLCLVEAIAMATNRPLLGEPIRGGRPLRVWYWNGEDPPDEIARRIEAICLHHGIGPDDLGDRLHTSDMMSDAITLASRLGKDGSALDSAVVSHIRETIRDLCIDVVIFDPFISVHRVAENDTGGIDLVAKCLARIAVEMGCAVGLAHHARKPMSGGSGEVTMADSRGAIALIDAARIGRTLNFMSGEEAIGCGVSPEDRRRYVRIDDGKANLSPRFDKARWLRLQSVDLGNPTADSPPDFVGVPEPWEMPGAFDVVMTDHLDEVVRRVRAAAADRRPYRKDQQSPDWIGHEVAAVLGLDVDAPGDKAKVKTVVATWIKNKALRVEHVEDERRKKRPCIFPGEGQ